MLGLGTKQEPLRLASDQRGHTAHLRLSGEIDITTAPILSEWLHAAESNGNSSVVVDLDQVTFMDAGGLRVFLRAADRANRGDRTFAITAASAMVQRILQITGTTHLLAADGWVPSVSRAYDEAAQASR